MGRLVGVAQLVESQVVALVVVGSSPISHPNFFQKKKKIFTQSEKSFAILISVSGFRAGLRRAEFVIPAFFKGTWNHGCRSIRTSPVSTAFGNGIVD